MKRTVIYERTVRVQQSIDVEYDTEERLDYALEQAEDCYDIYEVAKVLENNGMNVLNIDDEHDTDFGEDFEYYDDYVIGEEED